MNIVCFFLSFVMHFICTFVCLFADWLNRSPHREQKVLRWLFFSHSYFIQTPTTLYARASVGSVWCVFFLILYSNILVGHGHGLKLSFLAAIQYVQCFCFDTPEISKMKSIDEAREKKMCLIRKQRFVVHTQTHA